MQNKMGALTTCKDFVSHPHLVETIRTFKDKDGNEIKDSRMGGCYVCQCASSAEDINPIADALEIAGIKNEIHQTGGFTMCIYIKTGKHSYIYANAEGASAYKNDEDYEGTNLLFFGDEDTPIIKAQKLSLVMKHNKIKVKK
jgi:hypothetical protein